MKQRRSVMTNDSLAKFQIHSLPEEIQSQVFGFLTTPELTKYQATNSETHKQTKACVFLRRIHSLLREKSWFEDCEIQWNIERERSILTSIRNKLVNELQCYDSDYIEDIDTNSLIDFNRSIEWLENYDSNYEFIDLLLASAGTAHLWSSYELVYIDNWEHEFNNWFEGGPVPIAPTWRWERPLIHKMFDPEIGSGISVNA